MPAERTRRSTTRYRDRRCNDPNYEEYVQDTLAQVANNEYSSLRKASKHTGIPRSTLTDRAKGRHDAPPIASAKRQLLSPQQEDAIVQWCGLRASMGEPWSPAELRAQAEAISGKTVGQNWHRKFEKRHPEIRSAKPAKLDPKRAKHFNEEVIGDFYDKWEVVDTKHDGIPPEHIWNFDEKGVQMGGGRKKSSKKYYFLKDQKHRYRIRSDNLELVTILECISAAGEVVPPSFCLQNGSTPDLRELSDEEWGSIYFSESGWTDSYNAERWLDEVFIPFAKERRVDPSKPIVLFMDGHETHETPAMQRIVYKHLDNEDVEVILFCLPSKTTHKMQPLDVLVLSQVERSWQAVCDEAIKKKTPINRFTVIPAYIRGTRAAMTKEIIKKAFEKTGIYPINRGVFQPEDFAPSKASASVAHVPDSFPNDVPSSDPVEPTDAEDDEYDPSDSDGDSESDELQSIDLTKSASESDSDTETPSQIGDDNDMSPADGVGSQCKSELDDEDPCPPEMKPLSGLLSCLENIEDDIIHLTRSATANLNLFTVAPPKVVSVEEDRMLSPEAMFDELRSLRQNLMGAYRTLGCAIAQLSASNAHCTTIRRELDHVHEQLQNVMKKKERGSKKIKARFLTAKDLRSEFEREDAERQERERVAAEKNKQKEAENAETARRVADDAANRVFSGRISSYKKDDLRALALALGLSDKGGKKDINARIDNKFANDPDLKKNVRFSGLFNRPHTRRRRGQTPAVNSESDSNKGDESDLEPDGNEDTNENRTSNSVHPSVSMDPSTSAPQSVPAPLNYHPPPLYPHPNYYPYYTLNHPPLPQSGQRHPQQQFQFQYYNPYNPTR